MAQPQLFVSCVPAREGKQVREQTLGSPGVRLCRPNPTTSTAVLGILFQPQPGGALQGPVTGHREPDPRWEVSWPRTPAARHPHTPASRDSAPDLPQGQTSSHHRRGSEYQARESFSVLHFTKYPSQLLCSLNGVGPCIYYGAFPCDF